MQELSLFEIGLVGGAGKTQTAPWEPSTRGELEWGNLANSAFGAAMMFGGWPGSKICDWPRPRGAR